MKSINEFCGQENGYSRSITLRNKLVPVGNTKENFEEFLKKDEIRSKKYPIVKRVIDDYHREFIETTLSNNNYDNWERLFEGLSKYQSEKENKEPLKRNYVELQKEARKTISEWFTKDNPIYAKLVKGNLLTEIIPDFVAKKFEEDSEQKKEILDALVFFKDFNTYFTGFHENRENMYKNEEESTAISYRIVNENFPKFVGNFKLYNQLKEEFPQIISSTEESLREFLKGKKLDEIFNIQAFNDVLSQNGIDYYNTIIGGISYGLGQEKIKGLNEILTETKSTLPEKQKNRLKKKMVVLFKQILSTSKSKSFKLETFDNTKCVLDSLKEFNEKYLTSVVGEIRELIKSKDSYDLNEIFVPEKELANISQMFLGNWSVLPYALAQANNRKFKHEENEIKEKFGSKTKRLKSNVGFSLVELQQAYEVFTIAQNIDKAKCKIISEIWFDFVRQELIKDENEVILRDESGDVEVQKFNILDEIETKFSKIDFNTEFDLQKNKDDAILIKDYLDEVQNLYHYLKLFDYRGDEQKDSNFYSKLDQIIDELSDIVPLYNKIRNFVTKKPGENKKIKMMFDNSSLLNGWGTDYSSKEAHIFIDSGDYYLGIVNNKLTKEDIKLLDTNGERMITKVVYDFQKPDKKNTPRLFIRSKGDNYAPAVKKCDLPIKDVIEIYDNGWFKTEYRKKNPKKYKDSLVKLIDYFKLGFKKHESYAHYKYAWKESELYNDINEFYEDTIKSCYQLKFEQINFDNLINLVNKGSIFLFKIFNKDFSKGENGGAGATGKKNLHTLYWENLFSQENLKNVCLKLNGKAELFYRKPSINKSDVTIHEKGSIIVNRTTKDGETINEKEYLEIYEFLNKRNLKLSKKAKELYESGRVVYKEATHDIIKDKHYTEDTYLFHCPITMNFRASEVSGKDFNEKVLSYLNNNKEVKIIGLDRGERHLIYLSLINQKGEIELQKTLNFIDQVRCDKTVKIDYHDKLVKKEGNRALARKNWQTIGKIKDLKEGYLSNVVHEIAKMMIENNAIIIMEDLNIGFKRGRFAVERQIYQKFENMLIEKLNYLVFKDRGVLEPGGVLNAYQLTDKSMRVSDVYQQCGWIFYIPAAYTSKIDPKTGFVNLFRTKGLTNIDKKLEFFSKFDSIYYDNEEKCFVFCFDYQKVSENSDYKKKWNIFTKGERLVYNREQHKNILVDPTSKLEEVFDEFKLNWKSGENILNSLKNFSNDKANAKLFDTLLRMFNLTVQMRNSVTNSSKEDDDYLVSPVKSSDGTFFDSREEIKKGKDDTGKWVSTLPVDSDANGAYHIALKGLFMLKNNFNRNDKGEIQNISHEDWFKFVQTKAYQK